MLVCQEVGDQCIDPLLIDSFSYLLLIFLEYDGYYSCAHWLYIMEFLKRRTMARKMHIPLYYYQQAIFMRENLQFFVFQ